MIKDKAFVLRVREYYRDYAPHHTTPLLARAMMEFAPGVVAVHDNHNEFDLIFDPMRWELRPIWAGLPTSPVLEQLGLGVLEGVGSAPPPQSFEQTLIFAQRNLRSKTEKWNTKPAKITTPGI